MAGAALKAEVRCAAMASSSIAPSTRNKPRGETRKEGNCGVVYLPLLPRDGRRVEHEVLEGVLVLGDTVQGQEPAGCTGVSTSTSTNTRPKKGNTRCLNGVRKKKQTSRESTTCRSGTKVASRRAVRLSVPAHTSNDVEISRGGNLHHGAAATSIRDSPEVHVWPESLRHGAGSK